VPVKRILNTLVKMKTSGEIDDIIRLYIGDETRVPL
jgi:polar amino acid transport system substrate-binding protein